MSAVIVILLVSYLIGSIPTSIIVSSLLRNIDIRNYGSGNAGGTNVFRILGWKAGVFVIFFDMLKGALVSLWIVWYFQYYELNTLTNFNQVMLQLLGGTAAVIGHIYTIFAKMKGGKGVSATAGVMIATSPITTLIVIGIFLISLLITRYVSLSSMIAAISFPFVIIIRKYVFQLGDGIDYYVHVLGSVRAIHDSLDYSLIIFGFVFAFLIVYAHRSNIARLMTGTENRVVFFSHRS